MYVCLAIVSQSGSVEHRTDADVTRVGNSINIITNLTIVTIVIIIITTGVTDTVWCE